MRRSGFRLDKQMVCASPSRETEFEAPGLYAFTAPRLENALPRCAFPEEPIPKPSVWKRGEEGRFRGGRRRMRRIFSGFGKRTAAQQGLAEREKCKSSDPILPGRIRFSGSDPDGAYLTTFLTTMHFAEASLSSRSAFRMEAGASNCADGHRYRGFYPRPSALSAVSLFE